VAYGRQRGRVARLRTKETHAAQVQFRSLARSGRRLIGGRHPERPAVVDQSVPTWAESRVDNFLTLVRNACYTFTLSRSDPSCPETGVQAARNFYLNRRHSPARLRPNVGDPRRRKSCKATKRRVLAPKPLKRLDRRQKCSGEPNAAAGPEGASGLAVTKLRERAANLLKSFAGVNLCAPAAA
jgi:hypothetical protein